MRGYAWYGYGSGCVSWVVGYYLTQPDAGTDGIILIDRASRTLDLSLYFFLALNAQGPRLLLIAVIFLKTISLLPI